MEKLSKRLEHLAGLVTPGSVLADVGTDHGYLPIFLLENRRIPRAIALDIGSGPLLRARKNIEASGAGDYIEARLSDGVAALLPGEADSILIAGMGGETMLGILSRGREVVGRARELILQPQSEVRKVRAYLYQNGFAIDREDMVREDGKYYVMLHCLPGGRTGGCGKDGDFSGFRRTGAFPTDGKPPCALDAPPCRKVEGAHFGSLNSVFPALPGGKSDLREEGLQEEKWQIICRYGAYLLENRNEVLHEYLLYVLHQQEEIIEILLGQRETPAIRHRKRQVEDEIRYAKKALAYFVS